MEVGCVALYVWLSFKSEGRFICPSWLLLKGWLRRHSTSNNWVRARGPLQSLGLLRCLWLAAYAVQQLLSLITLSFVFHSSAWCVICGWPARGDHDTTWYAVSPSRHREHSHEMSPSNLRKVSAFLPSLPPFLISTSPSPPPPTLHFNPREGEGYLFPGDLFLAGKN